MNAQRLQHTYRDLVPIWQRIPMEDPRFRTLVAACATVGNDRSGVPAATVVLAVGPANTLLAPERLDWLARRYGVQVEVLDQGRLTTRRSIHITRPVTESGTTRRKAQPPIGGLCARLHCYLHSAIRWLGMHQWS